MNIMNIKIVRIPSPEGWSDCRHSGIRNLTPHAITVCGVDYPSTGVVRAETQTTPSGAVWVEDTTGMDYTIPVVSEVFTSPVFDGEVREGETIIVSRIAAAAIAANGGRLNGVRVDALYPTDFTRDEAGRITGAKALGRVRGES